MKMIAAIVCVVGVAGVGMWYARGRAAAPIAQQVPATRPATQPAALGVEEFMRNADAQRGAVSVIGVVSAASADKQAVMLIDTREFAECGIGCASLTLPVRWAGQMPAVQKTVRVAGRIEEADGKFMFVASAVQEVPQ